MFCCMRRKSTHKVFIDSPNNNDIDSRAALLQQVHHQAGSEKTDNESPSPVPLANNIFETLNADVIDVVLSYLTYSDLKNVSLLSKYSNELAARNLGYLKFIITTLGYPSKLQFKILGRLAAQNTFSLERYGCTYNAAINKKSETELCVNLKIPNPPDREASSRRRLYLTYPQTLSSTHTYNSLEIRKTIYNQHSFFETRCELKGPYAMRFFKQLQTPAAQNHTT